MNNQQLIYITVLLILAATPISLLIIELLDLTFLKKYQKLSKVKSICLKVTDTLIKKYLIVKTICYDDITIKCKDLDDSVLIRNNQNKTESSIIKNELYKEETLRLIASITHLCKFEKTENIDNTISNFFNKCRLNKALIDKDYEKIDIITNKIENKISSIICQERNTNEIFAFSKGNPYSILEKCTRIMENGKKEELTPQKKRKIKAEFNKINQKGQKIIAYAFKALPLKKLDNYSEQFVEKELIYIGLVSVTYPINRDITKDIEKIKSTKLKLYILTKIKERNAVAIAKELNIINPSYYESITGNYLESINQTKLQKILLNREKDYIFCELNKNQKNRILKELNDIGYPGFFSNKDEATNLEKLVESIFRSKKLNKNKSKIILHSIPNKITKTIIILLAIIINIIPPLTISIILIIDIIINLSLELSIREDATIKVKNLIKNIIFDSIIINIFLISIIYWNLLRLGWTLGEKIDSTTEILTNTTGMVFILLCIIQVIRAYKLSMYKNIFLTFTAILSLLLVYIFTNYSELNKYIGTQKPSVLELQILLLTTLIFIGITILINQIKNGFKRTEYSK